MDFRHFNDQTQRGMLNQLYLLQVLVHTVGKWSGSCCVLVGPGCWGPLHGEQAESGIQ